MDSAREHHNRVADTVESGVLRELAYGFSDISQTVPASERVAFNEAMGGTQSGAPPDHDFLLLDPLQTAMRVATLPQVVFLALCMLAFAALFWFDKTTAILIISAVFSAFYLAIVLFRAVILAKIDTLPHSNWKKLDASHTPPVVNGRYVVLAALYREASMVAPLVESLDALRWHGELEISLVCEHDDVETITAVLACLPRPGFRLLIVPPGSPRTKPRALNYALQRSHGDYLVIYDAEDRPHPHQLLEAASRFEREPADLACLQAPLVIDNAGASWLTRLYSIEYDTLFRGMLPTLSMLRAPIPLGGTSNHFRLPQLVAAGGWDSYNVTEDADLGMRLARRGYVCGTINAPTLEEAPAQLWPWLAQRTRWIKGWMQTLLVHLRNPGTTAREMGWRNFALFHVILTSLVISVLVHPFFLAAYFYQMSHYLSGTAMAPADIAMAGISSFNLVAGYLTYAFLAYAVERRLSPRPGSQAASIAWILLLPAYWLLISVAGWRACLQLVLRPHRWEKTPHGCSRRSQPSWIGNAPAE